MAPMLPNTLRRDFIAARGRIGREDPKVTLALAHTEVAGMTQGRNPTFEMRMKSLDERLLALEATPRVREAMTAGLTPPVPPPKRSFLKSASSRWPTAIRKPSRPPGANGEHRTRHEPNIGTRPPRAFSLLSPWFVAYWIELDPKAPRCPIPPSRW
jgi:hypothetical protein